MKKRYCSDCNKERDVFEETVEGEDYITCSRCANVIAKIEFNWQLPIDSGVDIEYNDNI